MEPIYVTQSSLPPLEEYVDYLQNIWSSKILTNQGVYHQELEHNISEYLKADYITLFTNGHLALESGIRSLNLKGEVITTPFSFASTTHALIRNGLKPVFCDIDPDSYCIDTTQIEKLITPNTCAILAVHVYGIPCNVEHIQQIADRHNLVVIYDSAHAFGVKINGTGIATYGDMNMFSFHATKVFHTIEGGALTYHDSKLVTRLDQAKNFGITGPETVESVGSNAKMNEFQAIMGLLNIKHINEEILKRSLIDALYNEAFAPISGIHTLQRKADISYNYAYFPVLIDERETGFGRDKLFAALADQNIFGRKYFYPLIPDFACYEYMNISSCKTLPVAKYVSSNILCLPIYANLETSVIERITRTIKSLKR